jgi:tRNA threonylcarbamoyladenosine biosynthesis protein TsaB
MTSGLVLVADLSASLCLALVSGGNVLVTRVRENARGESAHGLLDECFAETGLGPESLAAICVGAGPGSFTGIRVGVALAQGFAFARRLPLHPFSSLAALRACAPGGPAAGIIAANAGRYYASSGHPASESILSSDEVAALSGSHSVLVTCGPVPDRDRFAGLFGGMPRFEDIADFAKVAALAMAQPPVLDGVIRPNYLMPSAAEAKRLGGA